MIKVGKVVAVDEKTARVRVELLDNDGVITYWLQVAVPKAQNDKFYWIPDVGELVLCAFLEHGFEQGFVIGSLYNEKDLPPVASKDRFHVRFKDGSWIEYDRAGHRFSANIEGDANIKVKGNLVAETLGDTDIKAVGRCNINGDSQVYIKSSANITIQAPSLNLKGGSPANGVMEGSFKIIGSLEVQGDVSVQGNINATGAVIDEGGNTNHHSH